MKKCRFYYTIISVLLLFITSTFYGQGLESITFSSLASNDNNFQPIVGTPYGANLIGTNGSLEVSASYGESNYVPVGLSSTELQIKSNVLVYPNPTANEISIDLSNLDKGEYELYLVDLNSKVVCHKKTRELTTKFDLSSYSNGIYLLQVQTLKTNKIETHRIIKNK